LLGLRRQKGKCDKLVAYISTRYSWNWIFIVSGKAKNIGCSELPMIVHQFVFVLIFLPFFLSSIIQFALEILPVIVIFKKLKGCACPYFLFHPWFFNFVVFLFFNINSKKLELENIKFIFAIGIEIKIDGILNDFLTIFDF
jgi:hypothetical protein